ncbi:MAG: hypothetical protein M3R59_03200 [Verrucomicrobiota bacterium]|nr:hypothetical protein [Verrucomicrobiota bacterium]
MAKLQAESGIQDPAALRAITAGHDTEIAAIKKKLEMADQDLTLQDRILDLQDSSLTKDKQSVVAIREKIELLKSQQQSGNLTEQQFHAKGVEIHGLENDQLEREFNETLKPARQRAQETQRQARFRAFVANRARTGGLVRRILA